jgi:tetraacyldisaccharide 4'-kinase
LRVRRDINLCLLTPRDLEDQWNRVIPSGSWREDSSALQRADAFLINTTVDEDGCLEIMAHIKLMALGKPLFFFRISALGVTNTRTSAGMQTLEKIRYLLVTGIALPEKAVQTCRTHFKEQPIRHLIYPDHYAFTAKDWDTITQTAEAARCTHILCTPKDVVKLSPFADERLWVPQLTTTFAAHGSQTFKTWLRNQLDLKTHGNVQTERA